MPVNNHISLNGEWQAAFCDVGKGSLDTLNSMPVYPYHVPGDVHTALQEAGLIQEPLIALNDLDLRWVEEKEFWCARRFTLQKVDMRRHHRLTFEGLDCTADIYLNGQQIGGHDNAFVEVSFDVTGALRLGENILVVRIDDGSAKAKTHDLALMGMMWNNEQPYRVWMRKPQFVYGWDWTIWLSSCGIWRSVSLSGFDESTIEDMYAETLSEDVREGEEAVISVSLRSSAPCLRRITVYDRRGFLVAQETTAQNTLSFTIPSARLWWANGMGEAYLYTICGELLRDNGEVMDEQKISFGIRTVSLEEKLLPDGDSTFTFILNGQPVFCKGANHVPADCLPGRVTAEKETKLIQMARDAGMNMLRVWGGGVYASDAFMRACDEAGILVWHDFMYACGFYPDHDPEFMENITTEAEKAVLRLRHHPSLIGWSGNNEIQEMYRSIHRWHPELPFYGQSIYEIILPDVVKRLCPRLIYRPSSPYGGKEQADTHHGDQHIWKFTHIYNDPHYMDLWRFTEFDVKFFSEFGILGAMTLETAKSCIPEGHLKHDDPIWLHHSNSNRDWEVFDRMMLRYFDEIPEDAGQTILRSQALQAEITRHIYDEFRCRKFRCSGLLFWTLSDSMGIHNWSLIDYGLRRKPVYHALKRSMAPLAVAIRGWDVQNSDGEKEYLSHWRNTPDPLEIWGMNDMLAEETVTAEYSIVTVEGEVLQAEKKEALLPANASVCILSADVSKLYFDPEKTVLQARLHKDGAVIAESRYFFVPFRKMVNCAPDITCRSEPMGSNQWKVTLHSPSFVWLVHLAEPDGTVYSDNDFDLWPGETRMVTVTTDQKAFKPDFSFVR